MQHMSVSTVQVMHLLELDVCSINPLLQSGKFDDARRHAESSLEILCKHLPSEHLFLASSKRVLALILEEIAIDAVGQHPNATLLTKAEELHLYALNLAKLNFSECNVQTAKHYGNLGRLYQVYPCIET